MKKRPRRASLVDRLIGEAVSWGLSKREATHRQRTSEKKKDAEAFSKTAQRHSTGLRS